MSKSEREIRFAVPEVIADRIERLEGKSIIEIGRSLLLNFYEDKRRTQIEVHRLPISWHPELYAAILKHVGRGGVSRFIRDCIYEDLSKTQRDILEPPDWSETREEKRVVKKVKSSEGRTGYISPIVIPLQWFERLSSLYPNQVSPLVKSLVQKKLEATTGKTFPVQYTMREFLGREE